MIPTNFDINVAGNEQNPVQVKLSIGPNILMLGLGALVVFTAVKLKKGR